MLLPLEYTNVKGDVPPVMATLKLVDVPLQIDAVPEITEAVGPAFTVTTADPLFPVPAHPLAPVTETRVYVFVLVGLTEILDPEV